MEGNEDGVQVERRVLAPTDPGVPVEKYLEDLIRLPFAQKVHIRLNWRSIFVLFSLPSFQDVSVTQTPDSVFSSDLRVALG